MRIVIAFEPRPEFIKKIILWLREELKQKVILDLILNSEIVGGAIIEYQGKELDFSIAKKIDEIAEFKL
jgi:F0F1-type ATP synthase delta subunit